MKFISFQDILDDSSILDDIDVLINVGDADTAHTGGDWWVNPHIVEAVRKFVYNGIGVGEPTGHQFQGRFFQLADVFGVEEEHGFTLGYDKYNWDEHEHFILEETESVDFGEGKKNIYALAGSTILVQKDKEVQMAVNEYGKGRAVYISGLPYSFKNSRVLYRAVLWSASAEEELNCWYSTNYNVEVHAYVKNGKMTIFKRPKPAHKLRFNTPSGTRAVMGHTRMTTQGNEKFNYNNHPFYGHADGNFAFAHNGVLYNDIELRKEKHLPKTKIETDSYVAVQLIEQQGKLNFDALKNMAESVQGSFCFTVLDENNTLYIVKGSNSMCLLHFVGLGLYIYASTESILTRALWKVGLLKLKYEQISLKEGDMICINKNGELSESSFAMQNDFRNVVWQYSDYDWEDDYTQQEELLLEMCGCYGVSEEDVLLLLDYGYSADEIEEMLCDTTFLHDTLCAIQCQESNPAIF